MIYVRFWSDSLKFTCLWTGQLCRIGSWQWKTQAQLKETWKIHWQIPFRCFYLHHSGAMPALPSHLFEGACAKSLKAPTDTDTSRTFDFTTAHWTMTHWQTHLRVPVGKYRTLFVCFLSNTVAQHIHRSRATSTPPCSADFFFPRSKETKHYISTECPYLPEFPLILLLQPKFKGNSCESIGTQNSMCGSLWEIQWKHLPIIKTLFVFKLLHVNIILVKY